jgi:hypothetical protein
MVSVTGLEPETLDGRALHMSVLPDPVTWRLRGDNNAFSRINLRRRLGLIGFAEKRALRAACVPIPVMGYFCYG